MLEREILSIVIFVLTLLQRRYFLKVNDGQTLSDHDVNIILLFHQIKSNRCYCRSLDLNLENKDLMSLMRSHLMWMRHSLRLYKVCDSIWEFGAS